MAGPFRKGYHRNAYLHDIRSETITRLCEEAVELFFSPDKEGDVAEVLRPGIRDRFRHREHRFSHALIVLAVTLGKSGVCPTKAGASFHFNTVATTNTISRKGCISRSRTALVRLLPG